MGGGRDDEKMDLPTFNHDHGDRDGDAGDSHGGVLDQIEVVVDAESPLTLLSFPLASHLCSFLDARSLTALHAAAGRRAAGKVGEAACARALWAGLLRNDMRGEVEVPAAGAQETPKQAYLEAHAAAVALRKEQARQAERALRHHLRQELYGRFSNAFYVFQEQVVTCSLFPLLLVGVVLVATRLDSGGEVTLGDVAPFVAAVVLVSLACLCLCYASAADPPVPLADDTYEDTEGPLKEITHAYFKLGGDSSAAHVALAAVAGLVALQLLLLSLRAAGAVDGRWAVLMLPWWLVCAASLLAPALPRFDMPPPAYVFVWLIGAFLPCVVFPAMLADHLDGGSTELVNVFVPLWVWFGMALFGAAAAMCDEPAAGVGLCATWICFFGPVIAFQVMLLSSDSLSYTDVMAPLMWLASGMTLAGFGAGCALVDDRYN